MPVVPCDLTKWPNGRVPYTVSEKNLNDVYRDTIQTAATELNERVGKDIFVPKGLEDCWAEFEWGEAGSSDIGCKGKRPQKINLNTGWKAAERVKQTIHEMCHCLGFEHEEYASQNPMKDYGQKVERFWQFRKDTMLDKQKVRVRTLLPLDTNSVMMYDMWRLALPLEERTKYSSHKLGNYLSWRDISAIKMLYV
jgi:hypothetical protein